MMGKGAHRKKVRKLGERDTMRGIVANHISTGLPCYETVWQLGSLTENNTETIGQPRCHGSVQLWLDTVRTFSAMDNPAERRSRRIITLSLICVVARIEDDNWGNGAGGRSGRLA